MTPMAWCAAAAGSSPPPDASSSRRSTRTWRSALPLDTRAPRAAAVQPSPGRGWACVRSAGSPRTLLSASPTSGRAGTGASPPSCTRGPASVPGGCESWPRPRTRWPPGGQAGGFATVERRYGGAADPQGCLGRRGRGDQSGADRVTPAGGGLRPLVGGGGGAGDRRPVPDAGGAVHQGDDQAGRTRRAAPGGAFHRHAHGRPAHRRRARRPAGQPRQPSRDPAAADRGGPAHRRGSHRATACRDRRHRRAASPDGAAGARRGAQRLQRGGRRAPGTRGGPSGAAPARLDHGRNADARRLTSASAAFCTMQAKSGSVRRSYAAAICP
ncbi:hypothetical protein SGPA1_41125 [Streptomyces misionensis JCM 4497]